MAITIWIGLRLIWEYIDFDELCFQIEQSKSSLGILGLKSLEMRCGLYEIFEDDFYETSEQIQCGVYLKLDREWSTRLGWNMG